MKEGLRIGAVLRGILGLAVFAAALVGVSTAAPDRQPFLPDYIGEAAPAEMVPGADAYGEMRSDLPIIAAMRDGEVIGWVFVTSDFVATTGYSGKPIHILMAVDLDAHVTGVRLVKHSEPIILIGIPERKIKAATESYIGLDLVAEARADVMAHELDIISGATVTIMIIDDSIVRAGLRVARELELGGLVRRRDAAIGGPARTMVRDDIGIVEDWRMMTNDGSVRRLRLSLREVNQAFAEIGDERAESRRERGAPDDAFIDMYLGLVSQPTIGRSLLGDAEYEQLKAWLDDGEEAILIAAEGRYSFKGSGYVRGGIFDRIQLIQGDASVRFHDKQNRRLGGIAAANSPALSEIDIFKIPADAGFDPASAFRIQLLVQRPVGPIEKIYTTFNLNYQLPDQFINDTAAPGAENRSDELSHLWELIWRQKSVEAIVLMSAISVLTGVFFFQVELTRHARVTYWFRIGFLTFTLVYIGWYANAQLSVVNVLAFANAVMTDFSWSAFLMDPLIFILWFSVVASLLFWGRGAYCGWLCPFGALQELTNKIARAFHVPQIQVPWGIHERLWPIKYMIFLALFGVSLYSLELAEQYSEIEPFKTAIILKFARAWPFVLFALGLVGAGLFIERFYCRYLCPLGAALAIPGRMRMFDWLKRYKECGSPCQRCSNDCMVQAIHPEGHINPNECHQCLNCQVLYQSKTECPVCIKKFQRRQARKGISALDATNPTKL